MWQKEEAGTESWCTLDTRQGPLLNLPSFQCKNLETVSANIVTESGARTEREILKILPKSPAVVTVCTVAKVTEYIEQQAPDYSTAVQYTEGLITGWDMDMTGAITAALIQDSHLILPNVGRSLLRNLHLPTLNSCSLGCL